MSHGDNRIIHNNIYVMVSCSTKSVSQNYIDLAEDKCVGDTVLHFTAKYTELIN